MPSSLSIDGFRKQDVDVKRTSADREKLGRGRRCVHIKVVFRNWSATPKGRRRCPSTFCILELYLRNVELSMRKY